MPIYEFQCEKCNHQFEWFGFISKPFKIESISCEKCNGPTKRILSISNFHLKGKGWYKTDYKKGKE